MPPIDDDVRAGVHDLAPSLTAQQVAGLCGQSQFGYEESGMTEPLGLLGLRG